ncbi:MAG: M16 family metallopeptidase [Verrucomicrobiia bacterium]
MRTLLSPLYLLVVVSAGLGTLHAQTDPRQVVSPPLREVSIPKPQRVELDNGMILFLLEDHELPLIELSALIGVGSVDDPAGKEGLASLCASTMRTGGSTSTTGDEMDDILESLAASVELTADLTTTSVRMSTLKESFDRTLSLVADLLTRPAFPDGKIQLAKMEHHGGIARRNDEPFGIASREFKKIIYGANSPFARQEEHATIEAVSREDLIQFYRQWFQPNNLMLAVTGDFQPAAMESKIRQAFAGWKKIDFKRRPIPQVAYDFTPSVNLVKKEDIHQAHIWLGHLADTMKNPDYPALVIMRTVFGSGFTSRLFATVRSRMGLSYRVQGVYECNLDFPGTFFATCQTKAETMAVALDAMQKEIVSLCADPVTAEELSVAKDYYLNTFVFEFDSRAKIVNRLMSYEFYGYPPDFLETTRKEIHDVSREDVLRVARKYLRPEALRVLVVGNPEKFDQPLSRYGTVREVDITIPGQPAKP